MEMLGPADPRRVGEYQLLRRLGHGGMGRVYLGRSRGGRLVAIKLVAPELAGDEEFRRRFTHEVEAARAVGGFYTAQVVDADTQADPPWLVTAYIPGPSLQQAVAAHGPLPLGTVRVLGSGLAEGLAAIHDCGLIHRDLKPGNVILAHDGPRVIDFGISRALDGAQLSHSVIGTPGFMSPEQARGAHTTAASDVFSLACVLVYAATGTSPYGVARPEVFLYRILNERPDLAGLPSELVPLVSACLAAEPGGRPSVAEVLHALETEGDEPNWLPEAVMAMIADRAEATRVLPPGAFGGPTDEREPGGGGRRIRMATGASVLAAAVGFGIWALLPSDGGSRLTGSGTGSGTATGTSASTFTADNDPCDVIDNTIIADAQLTSTGSSGGYTTNSTTVKTCAWQSGELGGSSDTYTLAYTSARIDLVPDPKATASADISKYLKDIPSTAVYTSTGENSCEVVWPTSHGDAVAVNTTQSFTGINCLDAADFAALVYPRAPR